MKSLAIALLLSGAMLWAQSTTPQTPPAGAQGQTGAGTAQSPHHHGAAGQGTSGMGQQHMMDMQAMLDQMHTKMDRLRTSLASVKDPAAKDALQADYDMWQSVYTTMQSMHAMMQQQGGHGHPGMSGSGHGMMGTMPGHSGHPANTTPGTTNPQTPPQTPPPQSQTPPPAR